MYGELYRPLGHDIIRKEPRRSAFSPRRLVSVCACVALLAASLGIALLQPTHRAADRFAVQAAGPGAPASGVADAGPQTTAVLSAGDVSPGLETAGSELDAADPFADPASERIVVADPFSLRQPPRMAHVPDEALIEASAFGPLPARAADGRRPLDVYAGDPGNALGTRVAIVVGGLGISQTGTQAAIRALPQGVTFAFAPTGHSLGRWMQDARRSGHELLMQAPMEPVGYPRISPGPNTLTAADAAEGRFDELHAVLGRMTNYVGVMNYMGAQVSADGRAMEGFLAEISKRGLLYLDDASSARSLARDVATANAVPHAVSDVLIDRSQEPGDIRRQLDMLERIARAQGSAIGVASAFDVSVQTIAAWIAEARSRGVEVVPVSSLAFDPERG